MIFEDEAPHVRADARRNRERILLAAEQVFTECGATTSTDEVARRAGVAIGTVFRHFPTKNDLLHAATRRRLALIIAQADALDQDPGRDTALFTFLASMIEQAAAKQRMLELLGNGESEAHIADAMRRLESSVGRLLQHAQAAGTVGAHIQLPTVMALLTSICQGAVTGGWPGATQHQVLDIVITGLRLGSDDPES